jgi:xylan 1,4-beta-xylosidase
VTTTRIQVSEDNPQPLGDAWRHCVGTGRLNLALRTDYRDSLAMVQRDIGFRYIRGHGLLSDDMGLYRKSTADTGAFLRYSFTYIDQVFDSFLELGVRPFIELGFMPGALATGPETVFWWKGNITPPTDQRAWAAMVNALLRHLIDRYGLEEVRTWPIEVWNEPNLKDFWKDADQAAYFELYATTALAVKEVDAGLQVGGPAISPGADEWWEPFAEFVTRRGLPIDFVSRHAYSSGPGQKFPFGTYQTFKPPGHLLEQFEAPGKHLAGTGLAGLPVHITEFNTSYRPDNPIHDTAYNAAYLAPVLAGGGDYADSFSYWTFCDVFEEDDIPTSIFHGGFGLLTHRQLPKPTYHLYAFMARMGRDVLVRGDDHLVCRDVDGRITVLAWQPVGGTAADPTPDRHELRLSIPLTGPRAFVLRERVNEHDGNAFAAWRELGRPFSPDRHTQNLLRESAAPAVEHRAVGVDGGRFELDLTLSRHEVTFVEIVPVEPEQHTGLDDRRLLGVDDDRLVADHERRP